MKLKKRDVLLNLAILFFLIFIYGCRAGQKQYIRPDTDISNIKHIAVLPFQNFTSDRYAGTKVRSMATIELLTRGIEVIEPGEVTKTLRDLKVRFVNTITVEDIQHLGKTLGVEAVLMGSVETFGISKGISVDYPEVTVHLMLRDTASGKTIWSSLHSSGGASLWTRHFGAEGKTVDETAEQVVREAFDSLFWIPASTGMTSFP
jgi:hypothetical protein